MKIIGLGNALVDILAPLSTEDLLFELQLPKGSMQLIDDEKQKSVSKLFETMHPHLATGGSAGNTILALANLDASPGYIGKVGSDAMGEFFVRNCEEHNITAHLLYGTLPTGTAYTFISPDGERTFATYLGSAATMQAADLDPVMFDGYQYVYVEGYLLQDHALIERAMQIAKASHRKVCLDFASYNIVEGERTFIDYLLRNYVDIVFANQEEAFAFTGKQPERALQELAAICPTVVVKLGGDGAMVQRASESCHVAAYYVPNVVDTTGAGDFFAAGFMYGLTHGASLSQSAQIGTLLAARVIQIIGTTLSPVDWSEIKLKIQRIFAQ